MFILFISLLVIGLVGFAVVFMKEFKQGAPETVSLRDIRRSADSLHEQLSSPAARGLVEDPSHIVEIKAVKEAFEQRLSKLEGMLEEKNRALAELQARSGDIHEHQQQIESLKQIFHSQIDELKQQNRELKDELARVLDENLDLQTRVMAVHPQQAKLEVRPSLSSTGPVKADDIPSVPPVPAVDGQGETLSLHDVFGGGEKGLSDGSKTGLFEEKP